MKALSTRTLALLAVLMPPVSVQAAGVKDLDFMTGTWRAPATSDVIEEWWMPAEGNTKVGTFRWVTGGKVDVIELTIIREEADGTFLRFKHFGDDYRTWEKDGPLTYRLESAGNGKARFANVSDNPNEPAVMIYEKTHMGLRFRGTSHPETPAREGDLVIDFRMAR